MKVNTKAKYLTYAAWQGDLNNTRMCFETALIFAFLSNRVLVTPKDYRHYGQPEWEGNKWRPLHPEEWLHLEDLKRKVEMVPYEHYASLSKDWGRSDRADLVFSPGTAVFCFPKIPPSHSVQAKRLRHFAAGRSRFLEFTRRMQQSRTLRVKTPTLEHFYSFFYFSDKKAEIECKHLIRDNVRFRHEILTTANQIADRMGSYSAVHVRRSSDFLAQFPETKLSARHILDNISVLVPPTSRLYIATDEKNKNFFSSFRKRYEVCFLDDFSDVIPPRMSPAARAAVEQMVCALARVFVGTRLSTFSGYITRLRGYYGASDKQIHFTDGSPGSQNDSVGSPPFSWINWIKEGNPWWGREYKEAWDF